MSQIPRVYFEGELSPGMLFHLKEAQAHHLIHVLRVKKGQTIHAFTNQKKEFSAQVQAVLKDSVELRVMEILSHHEKPWKSVLVQAIPKSQKIDWIIEKATELGIDEVYPVITRYVVKTTVRVDRLQKIAQAASKQSRRLTIPFIHPPDGWAEFLKKSKNFNLAFIACLSPAPRQSIDQALQSFSGSGTVALAIGPEGDFSSDEIETAMKFGWIPIDLGSFVLRTETAAIASLAILNHELRKKGCFY